MIGMVHSDLKRYFHFSQLGFVLALLIFLGQIASKFPLIFTTEILRFIYKGDWLNTVFYISMAISVISLLGYIKGSQKKVVMFLHMGLLSLAIMFKSVPAQCSALFQGGITVGLDWLIIDLLVTAVIFTPFELFFPVKAEQSKFHEDWKTDLTYFVIFDLGIKFILFAIRFPAEFFFNNPNWNQMHLWVSSIAFVPQLLLALVIADLFQYLRHFTAHKVQFMWKFHSIHHSPKHIDWLSGSRSHLLDLIVDRAFIFIPLYVLGFSKGVFVAYTSIVSLQSVWAHSNSHIDLGWLKYVIVTPQFHHWHHAKDKLAHDKNFAVHFPVIDMIFGTYHPLSSGFPKETGIEDENFPKKGYIKQFLYPFK